METTINEKNIVEIRELPEKLNPDTVIFYSEHFKRLEGVKQGNAIKTKAKKFLKMKCLRYDPDMQEWKILPIKGYNKTTHTVKFIDKKLTCSCQFYNNVSKDWEEPTCSHILCVWLWLKVRNWDKERMEEFLKDEK